MNNQIIANINNPEKLEELYRVQKKQFYSWLAEAVETNPTSETLKVWNARVNYSSPEKKELDSKGLTLVIFLSLISFVLVKVPTFSAVPGEWYYSRFAPIIILTSLIIYFLTSNASSLLQRVSIVSGVTLSVLFMFFLPEKGSSATIIMSKIHMPLFVLSLLGVTYMSSNWRLSESRLDFIRYLGEIIIYSTIILLGGAVLTGVTIGLFSLINLSIEKWYGEYIVVLGLIATPIVATYLYDKVLKQSSNIATVIANTFSPLFLITVVCYIIAMFYAQKSPYSDREFLITFNGLLILVWGMTVFSIAGKREYHKSKIASFVNISLISVTLIINAIALSSIILRLVEYGVTPNRIVVIGSNLLIFTHLIIILYSYFKEVKKQQSKLLIKAIATFLPIYTGWSIFVITVLPVIFKFK